jgi:tripartite-type tricarboxylate transporter receptor subunit TctC
MVMINFRQYFKVAGTVALVLGAACFPTARAQGSDGYPSKPIHLVVPYPAGGTTDQVARAIAQPMREILGQAIVIDNKPGAGGTLGAEFVARQPADGYTLLFGNSGPSATAALLKKLPYDIKGDFRPISAVIKVPLILAVPSNSPYKTVKDFVEWAKTQGSDLNFGSTGLGGSSHLANEYFNQLAGTKFQHIPYAGGAPLVTAFAGGQIHMAFVTGLDGASMMQAGRIRYLAVASPTRSEVLPGLPAIAEDVPGFSAVVWFGVLAPKQMPDAIAEKLTAAIMKAVQRPEVRKFFVDRNVEPFGSTAAELGALIDSELKQWAPVIKKANIHLD